MPQLWGRSSWTVCITKYMFIVITRTDKAVDTILFNLQHKYNAIKEGDNCFYMLKVLKIKRDKAIYIPFRNSPIIWTLLVKAIVGKVANGNCMLIIAFKISFILLKLFMSAKNATKNVGIMAIVRVKRTRFHRAHCRFKNPSIANWPA